MAKHSFVIRTIRKFLSGYFSFFFCSTNCSTLNQVLAHHVRDIVLAEAPAPIVEDDQVAEIEEIENDEMEIEIIELARFKIFFEISLTLHYS